MPSNKIEASMQFPVSKWGDIEVFERFNGTRSTEGRRLGILALGGGQAGVISAAVCTGML